jgi:hypothetical protein
MTTQTTNTIPFSLVEKYAHIILISCEFLVMEFGRYGKASCERLCTGQHRWQNYLWNITPDGKVLGGQVIAFDTNGRVKNPWLESMMPTLSYDDISLAWDGIARRLDLTTMLLLYQIFFLPT